MNFLIRRPIPPLALNIIVASYILAVLNTGFWAQLNISFGADWASAFGLGAAVWALTLFTLELFCPWRLQRVMLILMITIASSASYYAQNFGVLIDADMIETILATTVNESRHLITLKLVIHITLTTILPALIIWKIPLKQSSIRHWLWRWPLGVTLSFAMMLAFVLSDFKSYSAAIRENGQIMANYQPGASLDAVGHFIISELAAPIGPRKAIGLDVRQGDAIKSSSKPVVFVLVLGETARAKNFGLQDGAPMTTPNLANRDLAYFSKTTSCGTLTSVSLPCMFSHLTEAEYSKNGFQSFENLADVLARAGFDVQWWDNNTGDQNIMRDLPQGWSLVDPTWDQAACEMGECTDEIFLPLIKDTLEKATKNTVLILHMIGSHGPAYYMRYPEARRLFTPDCRTNEFNKCTPEEIENAYNNSIAQTDYVLAEAINMLESTKRVDTALLYLSDHGESLGERGLYLHGAPKAFAPKTQYEVPFLIWLNENYQSRMGISQTCLKEKAPMPTSHDSFFNTMLGLLDLHSASRDPKLDLTDTCRVK